LVVSVLVAMDYFIGVRLWNLYLALFLSSVLFLPFYKEIPKNELKRYFTVLALSIAAVGLISLKKPIYFSM